MPRHTFFTILPAAIILMVSVFAPRQASCRTNLPEVEGQTVIERQDHQALRDYFVPFSQNDAHLPPAGQVRAILLGALPEAYKNGCTDMVAHWGPEAEGAKDMSVRVLYVDGGKEGRPVRALLAFACFSRAKEYATRFRDERLASLVVDRRASRLSMMPDDRDCGDCPGLTRIRPEKEIHIGGKGVVGLSFLKTNDNPCCSPSAGGMEEKVNFYVMRDDEIRQAGSVLKGREQPAGADEGKIVYTAGVIFKKDMRGNIIGILSPYTITKNSRRSDKGMVRYNWNGEREEFVKE
ncbi:MAG: hypothetical protein ABSC19_12160 [Syntrophorhabdales bacterium]|jgi:hypothetical protein